MGRIDHAPSHAATPNSGLMKRFINPPTPTYRALESAPALFTPVRIANDSTQDRGARNR